MGTGTLSHGLDHPPPSSAEFKEKVGPYSHSMPSWHFQQGLGCGTFDASCLSEDWKVRTVQYCAYVAIFFFDFLWLVHFWHLTRTVRLIILCLARNYVCSLMLADLWDSDEIIIVNVFNSTNDCTISAFKALTSFNIQKFCVLPTMHLCVLCGSKNKQRLFLYTALTYRFLKPKQRVFTARFEMGL